MFVLIICICNSRIRHNVPQATCHAGYPMGLSVPLTGNGFLDAKCHAKPNECPTLSGDNCKCLGEKYEGIGSAHLSSAECTKYCSSLGGKGLRWVRDGGGTIPGCKQCQCCAVHVKRDTSKCKRNFPNCGLPPKGNCDSSTFFCDWQIDDWVSEVRGAACGGKVSRCYCYCRF